MNSQELLLELMDYVNLNLKIQPKLMFNASVAERCEKSYMVESILPDDIEEFIRNKRKKTFNQLLFRYIDEKDACDAEIYNKAGIDRRLFSKIRSNPNYHPSKNTTIALSLALELDKEDALKLLKSAGHTLSDGDTFDLVILFFLEKRIYNINDVNMALDYFSFKPLVGSVE